MNAVPQQAHIVRAGAPDVTRVLAAKSLRAFADGYVAVLLAAYLLALGFGQWEIGLLSSMALLGSALMTTALGLWGHHVHRGQLLLWAALLMAATGLAFAATPVFWGLVGIAFMGTLNPSAGDVSVFNPLEQVLITDAAPGEKQLALLARYSLIGVICGALGALASMLPAPLSALTGRSELVVMRWMFVAYGLIGLLVWLLYRHPIFQTGQLATLPSRALGPSRKRVMKLAALFSLDAFGGGLVVNSLLALWLFQRFDMSLASAGLFFTVSGILTAFSQLLAPYLVRRLGLLNTMVFTHIPANLFLIAAALSPTLAISLALLFLRALFSHMDVPARTAFLVRVVQPEEKAAALSLTAVARSLAAALAPALGGALLAHGWLATPLALCGLLKITYDVVLWWAFRHIELDGPLAP